MPVYLIDQLRERQRLFDDFDYLAENRFALRVLTVEQAQITFGIYPKRGFPAQGGVAQTPWAGNPLLG